MNIANQTIESTYINSEPANHLAIKQSVSLLFKDVFETLLKTENESNEDGEDENSGATPNISNFSQEFADYFLNSPNGQQVLDDIYKKIPVTTDTESRS